MDVRAGQKDHHASPAGAVTRDKQFKGRREAKKRAYAAAEPWAVRAEARAAEERARAEARAKARAAENKALAEARAKARAAEQKALAEARADPTGQALADACVEIQFRTPHA